MIVVGRSFIMLISTINVKLLVTLRLKSLQKRAVKLIVKLNSDYAFNKNTDGPVNN